MHQGWTNHDTWHMNALIENNRYLFFKRNLYGDSYPFNEMTARKFVIDNSEHESAISMVDLENVNWHEIAEDWNSLGD